MSEQRKKSEAGLMLAKRGHSLKDNEPYKALSYFNRALMNLYNENNKTHLITVIMEMGSIFENADLLWAARNFYFYDFYLCLHQYEKFGKAFPIMTISAHILKYIELKLGHILYSTTFNYLEKVFIISDEMFMAVQQEKLTRTKKMKSRLQLCGRMLMRGQRQRILASPEL